MRGSQTDGPEAVTRNQMFATATPPRRLPRVLVLTDNRFLWEQFLGIVDSEKVEAEFTCRFSPMNVPFQMEFAGRSDFAALCVKSEWQRVVAEFELVFSLHCKQLFPAALVRAVRCINVHPGLNPHNRGWFPQVFSILNKLPLGATIHEMDEQLDHGPVIDQEEVPVHSWDTSLSAYNRVMEAELRLIRKNLNTIIRGDYVARPPAGEGNVNLQADFRRLCELDPGERATLGALMDRLRALTHGDHRNAYFVDGTGRKVFVRVDLQPETE